MSNKGKNWDTWPAKAERELLTKNEREERKSLVNKKCGDCGSSADRWQFGWHSKMCDLTFFICEVCGEVISVIMLGGRR